jgi:hypothetical protein
MANADTPFGLKPYRYINGTPWDGKVSMYYVSATDATRIGRGDPVKLMGSADSTGKYPTVARATTGGRFVGVAVGFGNNANGFFDYTNLSRAYRPASTAMYVAVVDDPNVVFLCQEDSATGALAATNVSGNADLVIGNCATGNGLSISEVDSSSFTSSTSAQVRLLRLANMEGNAIGSQAKWEVLILEHQLRTATGA